MCIRLLTQPSGKVSCLVGAFVFINKCIFLFLLCSPSREARDEPTSLILCKYVVVYTTCRAWVYLYASQVDVAALCLVLFNTGFTSNSYCRATELICKYPFAHPSLSYILSSSANS